MVQPSQPGVPGWVRAYLLVGAVQGLAIALTGLARPAHVVGFPLSDDAAQHAVRRVLLPRRRHRPARVGGRAPGDRHAHLRRRLRGRDGAAPRRDRLVLVDLHGRRRPVSVGRLLRARAGRRRRRALWTLDLRRAARPGPAPARARCYAARPRSSPCSASSSPSRPAPRCGSGRGRSRRCWRAPTRRSSSRSRSARALGRVRAAAAGGAAVRAQLARARRVDGRRVARPPRQVRRRPVHLTSGPSALAAGLAGPGGGAVAAHARPEPA